MDTEVKAALERVVEAVVAIEQPMPCATQEQPAPPMVEPDPEKVAIELRAAHEMQARMMWGVKRGVNPKDVASLKALRGMNRKQRRAALVQAGKRVRKVQVAKKRVSGKDRT